MSAVAAAPVRQGRAGRVLARAVGWDLRLQLRYQVITVAGAVTVFYVLLFRMVEPLRSDAAVVLFIFSDPTMIGFLFVGVMVLFERDANTLQAVAVTPLSTGRYLWSKAISLTIVALPLGVVMAYAGHGAGVNLAYLILGLGLSSVLFVFVGCFAVARVRSVNEYLLIVPQFLIPAVLPIVDTVGLFESPLFYLFPTQASLVLLSAALEPRPAWEIGYAVVYLTVTVAAAYLVTRRSFDRRVRRAGGTR